MTPLRDTVRQSVALSLVVLCAGGLRASKIAVRDDWADRGTITVAGEKCELLCRKGEAGLVLSAGDQSVRMALSDEAGGVAVLSSCKVLTEDAEKSVEVHAVFSTGKLSAGVRFEVGADGIVRVTPSNGATCLDIVASVSFGMLPGRRLESVLYRPGDFSEDKWLEIPSENWFAGLLPGEGGIVACAWPEGAQRLTMRTPSKTGDGCFRSIRLAMDGKAAYVSLLAAPGIWHAENLRLDSLEKDVKIDWSRPFAAGWRTELVLRGQTPALLAFSFASGRRSVWRPESGWLVWPVWFVGDQAFMHMSKKIPPRGEAIVYPISGHAGSLVGFVDRTPVGKVFAERLKRRRSFAGPKGAPNVGYTACAGTYCIRRTIYKRGMQHREKEYLSEHADMLADAVAGIQLRNAAYSDFIEKMQARLRGWLDDEKGNAETAAFLERMLEHVVRVEKAHREKMTIYGGSTPEDHVALANRNAERLKELFNTPGKEVFPECAYLIDTFNQISWIHHETTRTRFGMLSRTWALDAAISGARHPGTAEYAREIRQAIRETLEAGG